mgnify:FL=1
MKKPDYSTDVEYEINNNRPYLVLKRKTKTSDTLPCPFCGSKHSHGTADGHRCSHCGHGPEVKKNVVAEDGTILNQSDGYIIKTMDKK